MSFQFRSRTQDKETGQRQTRLKLNQRLLPWLQLPYIYMRGGYRLQSVLTQISCVEVLSLN